MQNFRSRRSLLTSALCSLAMTVFAVTPSQAQVVKPVKIVGSGIALTGLPLPGQPARVHPSEGHATHLGHYTGTGSVRTDSAMPVDFDPTTGLPGSFIGEFGSGDPYVFTGANGDQLVCFYGRTDKGASTPGTFELRVRGILLDDDGVPILDPNGSPIFIVQAYFTAEFVPQPELCTGKFAGVTGRWVMYAATDPFILGSSDPTAYTWEGEGKLTFKK
jgi:hypothetical protein